MLEKFSVVVLGLTRHVSAASADQRVIEDTMARPTKSFRIISSV
jgi:hypothetical protein